MSAEPSASYRTADGGRRRVTALARTVGAAGVLVLTLSALSPAASIYISGAGVLRMAGTGAAWALIVGGLIAVLAAILVAELAAAFPAAGGVYVGVTGVLGRGPGLVTAVLGLISATAALALSASGLADYLRVLAPALPKLPVALAALSAGAVLAVLPLRANAWMTGAFLAVELLAILVLVAVAAAHPVRGPGEILLHPSTLGPGHRLVPTPFWTIALAALSSVYACSGSGMAIYFSEDVRGDPARIGRVIVLGGVIAAVVISVPLLLVTAAMPDLAGSLASEAPISRTLRALAGAPIAAAVALAVALAIFNNIIATVLAFSRFVYATARDGMWPARINSWASSIDRRSGSPWQAALPLVVASGALCLLPERSLLILLSGDVFTATLVAVSVLVGRRRGLTGATTFRSPLFPAVPMIGLLFVAAVSVVDWRDPDAGRPSLLLLTGVVASTSLYVWVSRRRRV